MHFGINICMRKNMRQDSIVSQNNEFKMEILFRVCFILCFMKLSPGWQRILFNTICYDTKKVAKNVYIPTSALKPKSHTMLVRTIYIQKFYTVPLVHTCMQGCAVRCPRTLVISHAQRFERTSQPTV